MEKGAILMLPIVGRFSFITTYCVFNTFKPIVVFEKKKYKEKNEKIKKRNKKASRLHRRLFETLRRTISYC
jgi:hypothetical protein